ncbi:MAG: cyclic nucleotide-binding domain-containing protein [Bdellovibrionales bacterium]|nr:cyclic nucleotide-binding domain-containing protein [Bdellovibrionales bacterium]
MARIELFTPKFKKGHWTVKKEKLYFEEDGSEEVHGPFERDFEAITKLLNGMYNLSELFLALEKKSIQFSFTRVLSFLEHLVNLGLIENGNEYLDYYAKLQSGAAEHSSSHQELTEAYFTKDRIKAFIQKTCLVPEGDSEVLNKLVKYARLVHSQPGDTLIAQGSEGKEFCVLMSGKLGVYREEYGQRKYITELNPVCVFGESPAISGKKRNAEVSSLHSSWVLAIRIRDLMDPSQAEEFAEIKSLRTRLIINQILNCSPLFKNVPSEILSRFLNKSGVLSHEASENVLLEGDFGDIFYVILDGHVEVKLKDHKISELKKGDFFGEMGILSGGQRSATVKTLSRCHLLIIRAEDLKELLSASFYLAFNLEEEAQRRILENTEQRHNLGVPLDDANTITDTSFSDYDFDDLDFSSISIADISGISDIED